MKLLHVSAFAVSLGLAGCARSTAPPEPLPEPAVDGRDVAAVDVEHYVVDVTLDPANGRLEGRCGIRFALQGAGRGELVELDLRELEVSDVRDDAGRPLAWSHERGRLRIELGADPPRRGDPATREVWIDYGGAPRKGLVFVGGSDGYAYTHGQCEDARWWFPCRDTPADLATFELRVTAPADWTVVAGGERVDVREDSVGGTRTEVWRQHRPHAPYLASLVAGNLAAVEIEGAVATRLLAPAAHASRLPGALAVTPDDLAFLGELTGHPYPHARQTIACVDRLPVEGMANASLTTLHLASLRGPLARADRPVAPIVVHEAAHSWFGALVACADWSHVWLNEGFATYAADLWIERTAGEEAFHERRLAELERYLAAGRARPRALVHEEYREPADLLHTGHAAEGGMTRLHLLRAWLGDDAFFAGLRRHVGAGAGRAVTTSDLRRAFEESSGEDLGRFFAQWVYAPGHPVLEVGWEWDPARERILLRVHQRQDVSGGVPDAFEGPVDVELRVAGETRRQTVRLEARRQLFELAASEEPEWVRFDPERAWPAELDVRRTTEEWRRLVGDDPSAWGRRAAVEAIAERAARFAEGSEDRAILVADVLARLREDPARTVRAAAATALGALGTERDALVGAAREDAAPLVRVAALEGLAASSAAADEGLAELGRALSRTGPSHAVRGAAAALVVRADPDGAADWIAARLENLASAVPSDADPLAGEPWGGLVRAAASLPPDDAIRLLRPLVDGGSEAPAPARIEAVRAVVRVAASRAWLRPALGELLRDESPRVRRIAVEALAFLRDDDTRARLTRYAPDALYPHERRVIEAVLGL